MATVVLPSLLAAEAGGRKRLDVEGDTVAALLRALPVADLILDERGALRTHVNVYVDGRDARDLATPVEPGSTVRVVAAVAGG